MGLYGGNGLTPSLKGLTTNVVALKAGQVQLIPAGWFEGRAQSWVSVAMSTTSPEFVASNAAVTECFAAPLTPPTTRTTPGWAGDRRTGSCWRSVAGSRDKSATTGSLQVPEVVVGRSTVTR